MKATLCDARLGVDEVRQIASRVTALHFGRIFARGSIDEIMADERVAEIYLGKGRGAPAHA